LEDFSTLGKQGVFLLNTALTVESTKPSHIKVLGRFISKVITFIAHNQPCMWLLWGESKSYTTQIPHKTIFDVKNYSKETIEGIPTSPYFNYILKQQLILLQNAIKAMQDF
jgi:uracil DNA glycosylase